MRSYLVGACALVGVPIVARPRKYPTIVRVSSSVSCRSDMGSSSRHIDTSSSARTSMTVAIVRSADPECLLSEGLVGIGLDEAREGSHQARARREWLALIGSVHSGAERVHGEAE